VDSKCQGKRAEMYVGSLSIFSPLDLLRERWNELVSGAEAEKQIKFQIQNFRSNLN
jgi:hypothetical protein